MERRILFRNTPAAKLCKSLLAPSARKASALSQRKKCLGCNIFIINRLHRAAKYALSWAAFSVSLASGRGFQVSTNFSTTGHGPVEPRPSPPNCHILFIFQGFCRSYPEVTEHISLPLQIVRGPRSTRAGRNRMARRSSKTPPTAMPTSRKGSSNSQIIGYSTSASSASGQQITSRIHHKMKPAMMLTPT